MTKFASLLRHITFALFLILAGAAHAATLRDGERRIVLNGVEHWVRVAGAKQGTIPLVIIHGGPGGNVYTFERTIGPALERFTTVAYYDQRGSGRSSAPFDKADYRMPTLVSDLEALRAALGTERMNVLGFSFGALIAMEYAIAHPGRVEHLILQSAPDGDYRRLAAVQTWGFQAVSADERREQIRALASKPITSPMERMNALWNLADQETVDRFLFHKPEAAALNRKLWQESGLTNTGLMAAAIFADENSRAMPLVDELHRVKADTLILVGEYDRNVGIDMERDLASRFARARLVILKDSAHFPDIEHPVAYADAVREQLGRR